MRLILKSITFLFLIIILFSCDEMNERVLPNYTGKAGDLLVVVDSNYYAGTPGEAIKNVFAKQQPGLLQKEAQFNLIHIPHRAFSKVFRNTRNIIMVTIDPESKIKLSVREEIWAKTQMVILITAPTGQLAAETITKNSEALTDYLNNKEVERLKLKYAVNSNSKMAKFLLDNYQLSLNIDDQYNVAAKDKDFVWLRKEKLVGGHPVGQGIIIYTYPYVSDSTFDVGELVKKRNSYTKKYISGSIEGSFMQSFIGYVPNQREVNLNGNDIYVNELRGHWQMEGDFMGGPYINCSMVDEKNNRVICIDGYVYAPKFDKREYLREQEALIKSINF